MELPLFLIIGLLSLGPAAAWLLHNSARRREAGAQFFDANKGGVAASRRRSFITPRLRRSALTVAAGAGAFLFNATAVFAQGERAARREGGGEANLVLPDLSSVSFLGLDGRTLLMLGLVVCVLGLLFGLAIFMQLKNLPVHR